jgi:hypothetical protein
MKFNVNFTFWGRLIMKQKKMKYSDIFGIIMHE